MNLHIKVIEAVDVPKMDVFSKSDPYCVISLTGFPGRKRTKTIQNTDHPVWNEEFHFPIQNKKNAPFNDFGSIKISVTLFDEDTFSKDDAISSIEISLNDYIVGRIYDEWYSLFPFKKLKEGGRIHMMVNVLPKDIKPFTQMSINQMNSSMNYSCSVPSQLPQLNQNQMMMNQNQMYMQRQQQAMNQYPQMGVQCQQPMNPYLQQQQQLQMQQMQFQQMQQMQQMQRIQQMQQMQRIQTFQSNPYLAQQPQVYSPMPNYNYSNMNGNMMYGAVPQPTQNVGYPTVTPSQLPRISNTHNTF